MPLSNPAVLGFACLAIGLLVMGLRLGLLWQRWTQARRGRAHQLQGERGERQAERLLLKLGYRVRGRQVAGSYALLVDGAERRVQVVADLLVERDGRELVAEVKTGRNAPRPGFADTRRQLLEYQLAFAVPAVLLVDVEASRVRELCFPIAEEARAKSAGGWWAALFVMAVGLTLWWMAR